MEFPLTPYARPQWAGFGAVLLVLMAACVLTGWYIAAAVATVLLAALLSFFRDPERKVPEGDGLLVAPADGKITSVEEADDTTLGCRVTRVSIFLSVLDVHINRSPCAATVREVSYAPGRKMNAMNPDSARVNESNTLVLESTEREGVRVSVKQIAGILARRIVCVASAGTTLERGERFGMIKFGSRTDLSVPVEALGELRVSTGEQVYAGKTVIGALR
jgi:phosphatidylserine decarboxylase